MGELVDDKMLFSADDFKKIIDSLIAIVQHEPTKFEFSCGMWSKAWIKINYEKKVIENEPGRIPKTKKN